MWCGAPLVDQVTEPNERQQGPDGGEGKIDGEKNAFQLRRAVHVEGEELKHEERDGRDEREDLRKKGQTETVRPDSQSLRVMAVQYQ